MKTGDRWTRIKRHDIVSQSRRPHFWNSRLVEVVSNARSSIALTRTILWLRRCGVLGRSKLTKESKIRHSHALCVWSAGDTGRHGLMPWYPCTMVVEDAIQSDDTVPKLPLKVPRYDGCKLF